MTCKWFIIMVSFGPLSRVDLVVNVLLYPLTLQETNISHHGKRKISFKRALGRGYISSLKGNHLLTEVILLPPMLFPQLEPRPNRTDSAPEFLNYVFFFFFRRATWKHLVSYELRRCLYPIETNKHAVFWYGGK